MAYNADKEVKMTSPDPVWGVLRGEEGRRLSWVARRLGVSYAYVRSLSSGERHPTMRIQQRLSLILGRPISDLFLDGAEHRAYRYHKKAADLALR
jgi:transcriptional regulator with XRE-family HTH domain